MATNYANGLKSSRFMGGSASSVHPFIKGYFYVFFKFPRIISNETHKDFGKTLRSLCEGYQPPGDRQIKYEDVMGMGGVDSSFITGQTLDRNFSLNFRDVWGAPIFKIHREWTKIIDPFLGGHVKEKDDTISFIPSDYKGSVMIVQTKPIMVNGNSKDFKPEDIIKVDIMDGVFPLTDLSSVYDANISDNSIVKPTVQYRFDGAKFDETTIKKEDIVSLLKDKAQNTNPSKFGETPTSLK